MKNILKNEEGVTLVEVVIAVALLVIFCTMFGGIISSAYRSNTKLGVMKQGRETQNKYVEQKVGSDSGKATDIGTVDVELDFSGSGLSESEFGAVYATQSKNDTLKVYMSGAYGMSTEQSEKDRHVFAYSN